jgi:hypothetical protein|tara:strand:+ start:1760 stop:1921 length:162 start_codon:yes stop_codon:yes gene_type:complete
MDYIQLGISLAYTTGLSFWIMNHLRFIYNHQFEVTDQIIAKLTKYDYLSMEEE